MSDLFNGFDGDPNGDPASAEPDAEQRTAEPTPRPAAQPSGATQTTQPSERAPHRWKVQIQAYARLSYNDELEIDGMIGPTFFEVASKTKFRKLTVEGTLNGLTNRLRYKLQRYRGFPVAGVVLGQPVAGHVTRTGGIVRFDGMAGQEPLHYQLNAAGSVTRDDREIGLKLVYQSLYTEVSGYVERGHDAIMVALLLPMLHYKQEVTTTT